MKIYWAGPLFTLAERNFNVVCAEYLRSQYHIDVWLPQAMEPREKTADAIFAKDVEGIDQAHAVVAVMDGPDPDSGTCWECGYAYAKGKPVITVRTDFRNNSDGDFDGANVRFNLMLHSSASLRIYKPFCPLPDLMKAVAASVTVAACQPFKEAK